MIRKFVNERASSSGAAGLRGLAKLTARKPKKPKRRVRFASGANRVTPLPTAYYEETEETSKDKLWYTSEEISEMFNSARVQSRRRSADLEHPLNEIYNLHSPSGEKQADEAAHTLFDQAKTLLDVFEEQRGIEMFSSKRYARSRDMTLKQVKSEVMKHQQTSGAARRVMLSTSMSLEQAYAAASARDVIFARFLGMLDAHVAAKEAAASGGVVGGSALLIHKDPLRSSTSSCGTADTIVSSSSFDSQSSLVEC